MKLSTQIRYGTRAMLEIARHFGGTSVKLKQIVREQQLPRNYLENILLRLKKQKLIRTERGANGGYILNSQPSTISLLQVVDALEGSIAPAECIENSDNCTRSEKCAVRKAWARLHTAQVTVLQSISLQDLLDMEKETDGTLMYFI